MYTGIIQRVQRLEIFFEEEDFKAWKKDNPHVSHTHENYVRDMAEACSDDVDLWDTYEQDIICILYNSERE